MGPIRRGPSAKRHEAHRLPSPTHRRRTRATSLRKVADGPARDGPGPLNPLPPCCRWVLPRTDSSRRACRRMALGGHRSLEQFSPEHASVSRFASRRPPSQGRVSTVVRNGTHQCRDIGGLEHRRHVLHDDGAQCTMQVCRWVAFAPAGCDAIAKDLPRGLTKSVSRFTRTSGLDAAKSLKQQGRGNLRKGQAADPREQVLLHPVDPALEVPRSPSTTLRRVKFLRDDLEGRAGGHLFGELLELSVLSRVDALTLDLSNFVSCIARLLQTDHHLG